MEVNQGHLLKDLHDIQNRLGAMKVVDLSKKLDDMSEVEICFLETAVKVIQTLLTGRK
ncbi:MAG: hypothetical protein KAS04_06045 [Candidatus Aenigmarchaeota archaeon]|nr:hypothetical protein [Candidatus Aenigmarchaeota archaeon]